MYHKMLLPLDGSELAEVVFAYAKELAGRLDIDVTLLHVSTQTTHDFVPMQEAYIKRAAEKVKRRPVGGGQLGGFVQGPAPAASRLDKDVGRALIGIAANVIPLRPDHHRVAANGHGDAELVTPHPVGGGQFGLLDERVDGQRVGGVGVINEDVDCQWRGFQ